MRRTLLVVEDHLIVLLANVMPALGIKSDEQENTNSVPIKWVRAQATLTPNAYNTRFFYTHTLTNTNALRNQSWCEMNV